METPYRVMLLKFTRALRLLKQDLLPESAEQRLPYFWAGTHLQIMAVAQSKGIASSRTLEQQMLSLTL